MSFPKWYSKRLIRVYTPVLIITFLFFVLGCYTVTAEKSALWWFAYPTYYHFVASIIVLYIPFYWIMRIEKLKQNTPRIMLGLGIIYLFIYICLYDKTYYHIDTVRESMIRFLFMESMLLGAWFRINDHKIRNKSKKILFIALPIAFLVYMGSKLLFSKITYLSLFQILNQVFIFLLLYLIMRVFCGLDEKLGNLSEGVKGIVTYISELTLEIYLVQYVIIDLLATQFIFPINWVVLTTFIIVAAQILHWISQFFIKRLTQFLDKLNTRAFSHKNR